jgi:signal transduction histidine kinase
MLATLALAIAAVSAVVIAEWRRATPAWRRAVRPATAVLLCIVAAFVVAALLSAVLGADDGLARAAFWVPSVCAAAFPFAVLLVQSRERLFPPRGLRDMVTRLAPGATRQDLEATMAQALGDPSLRLVFRVPPAGFVGVDGTLVDVTDPTRTMTEISDGDRFVAGILHDPILEQPLPGVVESAGAAVLLALENARLEAEVRTTARELRESRARILAAGLIERRRLERDLHDTAQQRLVMLRLKLGLAEQEAGDGAANGNGAELLGRLGSEVEEILDGLRQVGRGLYPPLLGEHGLAAALRSEVRDHDGTELLIGEVGRSRSELEMAVFLSCREALSCLAEEGAGGDATLQVEARADWLRVNLSGPADDAPDGLAERVAGHMRDAVSALGGRADATGATVDRWSVTAYVPWPRTGVAAV